MTTAPLAPRPRYPWLDSFLCVLPTLLTVAGLWAVFSSETAVECYFHALRDAHPLYRGAVEFVTDNGNLFLHIPFVWLLACGLRRRRPTEARFVMAYMIALGVTFLLVYLLKEGVGRARPFVDEYQYLPWVAGDDYDSFPSGHTTQALSAVTALALWIRSPGRAALLGVLGALVPATRILLGVHFMTDLLGGIVMATVCGLLTWTLMHRLGGVNPGNPR